jgi:hypothetical protein
MSMMSLALLTSAIAAPLAPPGDRASRRPLLEMVEFARRNQLI